MTSDVEVVLSLGSNCGDRHLQVKDGIAWLKDRLLQAVASSIYTTGDCHGGPRDYYNAVVKGITSKGPDELDKLCKQYETEHGRTIDARLRGDVPVDIDIVIYDRNIVRPKDFSRQFFQIGYQEITE